MDAIPEPARERFLKILRILESGDPDKLYTSAELEALSGWPSHTIRKDISCLGMARPGTDKPAMDKPGPERPEQSPAERPEAPGGERLSYGERLNAGTSAGYDPRRLIPLIKEALGLERRRKFCVVGLGRLGSAYLNLEPGSEDSPLGSPLGEFELAAGFDSNVNRVEILKSSVPLYPAYKMGEVIRRFGIEIALLCVPAEAAQSAAEKLAAAGIRGILNFAPVNLALNADNTVAVRNVYVTDELRALSMKIGMKKEEEEEHHTKAPRH